MDNSGWVLFGNIYPCLGTVIQSHGMISSALPWTHLRRLSGNQVRCQGLRCNCFSLRVRTCLREKLPEIVGFAIGTGRKKIPRKSGSTQRPMNTWEMSTRSLCSTSLGEPETQGTVTSTKLPNYIPSPNDCSDLNVVPLSGWQFIKMGGNNLPRILHPTCITKLN